MAEDVNISPEMINNLINMLKNTDLNDNSSESSSSSVDLNTLFKNFSSENSESQNNSSDSNRKYWFWYHFKD